MRRASRLQSLRRPPSSRRTTVDITGTTATIADRAYIFIPVIGIVIIATGVIGRLGRGTLRAARLVGPGSLDIPKPSVRALQSRRDPSRGDALSTRYSR